MHCRTLLLLLLAAAIAAGCGRSSTSPAPVASVTPRTYPEKAVVHWQSLETWDEATIEQAAAATMMIIPIDRCFSNDPQDVLGQVRRLNPNIQIIGCQPVMGVISLYPDTSYLRSTIPYALDYYNAVRGDWAWTTAGDTLMMWKDLIMLNPIKNGALNRDLIDRIVQLIVRYQTKSGGALNGIMDDYFMYEPYINSDIQTNVLGDVDFDGDGVPYASDAEEQNLFYRWQVEYARALHEALGSNFIQIGNGRPPQEDAALAGWLNGIFYELYPNNPWGWTDRAGLLSLLDNQRAGYLAKAKGRTWSVCTNERGNASGNNMFCLLSSLLAGCMYTEMQGSYTFSGWTLDVQSGAPVGAAAIEGKMDSILTVKRAFDNGEVRISFYDTGRREQYLFEATVPPAR